MIRMTILIEEIYLGWHDIVTLKHFVETDIAYGVSEGEQTINAKSAISVRLSLLKSERGTCTDQVV